MRVPKHISNPFTALVFVFLVLLTGNLAAQDPSRGFGDIEIDPPSISIDVTSGLTGSTDFLVKNVGTGVLMVYTIEDDADWMSEDPVNFTVQPDESQTVTLTVDAGELSEGIYNQFMSIESNDPDEGTVTVAVTVNVSEGFFPDIWVNPTRISVTIGPGESVDELFFIGNRGNVDLEVSSITDDADWLTVNPTTLTVSPGDSQQVTVTIDPASSSQGTYEAIITVFSNDPNEPQIEIQVTENLHGQGKDARDLNPGQLWLGTPTPNPFTMSTLLQFNLTETTHVVLAVYDHMGRRVALLSDAVYQPGLHVTNWNGTGMEGIRVAPGTYFARLEVEGNALVVPVQYLR